MLEVTPFEGKIIRAYARFFTAYFEEFAVYDTRIKPDQRDEASVGRIFYCKFTDYEKEWEL